MQVLIIGLDGVTWDVLDDTVLRQHMPHLYRLKQSGTHGVLESTLPAVTPAAWTTCTSGCHPYRHGLVNFHQYAFSDNSYYYTHSGVVKVPGMWHYLSDQGYHVASINVPMTFPVYPINGFMISGLGCPGPHSDFVYPSWFKEVLLQAIPDYAPGLGSDAPDKKNNVFGHGEVGFRKGIEQMSRRFDQRLEAARLTHSQQPVDVMMVQFQQLDLLQHLCWPYVSAHTRDHHPWQRDRIFELYAHLDQIIGELVRMADQDHVLVAVVSDHGFGPIHTSVNVNRLLMEWGYLHRSGPLRRTIRRSKRNWMKFRNHSHRRMRLDLKQPIDLSRTRAMVLFNPTIGILHLNVKGRQRGGCVQADGEYQTLIGELKHRFGEVVNPFNGERVFEQVVTPDELWGQEHADNETYGDLMLIQKKGYHISTSMKSDAEIFCKARSGALDSSWHYPEGIFVLHGNGIRRGHCVNAAIADIAPTVYTWLNMSIPAEVDGSVILEAFEAPPPVNKRSEVKYPASFTQEGSDSGHSTPQEEKALIEQLKNLGYL